MESDGIDYLLTHVEERNAGTIEAQRQDKWTYKIDGKSNAHPLMAIPLAVISVFFLILAVDQLQSRPGKTALFAFFFGLIAVIILYGLIAVLVRYFCFSVYIGGSGFYFRSHPFNGKFYRYTDIRRCREELRGGLAGHSSDRLYAYFFIFTDKHGKSRKFRFDKAAYEREIDALKQRIEEANQ